MASTEVHENAENDGEEHVPTVDDVPRLLRSVFDDGATAETRLALATAVRRMLCGEDIETPAKQLVEMSILGNMVLFLSRDDEPMLQYEVAWALSNIAATEFAATVVRAGALPGLVRLLECPTAGVREMAVLCIGNVAVASIELRDLVTETVVQAGALQGLVRSLECPTADVCEQAASCIGDVALDSIKLRDLVLKSGALTALLRNVANPDSAILLARVVWAISKLCQGIPKPDFALVRDCIPAMNKAIVHTMSSSEARTDALWTLYYLSGGEDIRIKAILEAEQVIPQAIVALKSENVLLMFPALQILGNIVTGNAEQTQVVLDAGILDLVPALLENSRYRIRKDTAWILSNIAAGTSDQVSQICNRLDLVRALIDLSRYAPSEIRKEAILCVSNLCSSGRATPKQVQMLVDHGVIEAMADVFLDFTDAALVLVALEALGAVLQGDKPHQAAFVEAGGVSRLKNLQSSKDDGIKQAVEELLALVVVEEEEEEEEDNVPVLVVAVEEEPSQVSHEHEELSIPPNGISRWS